MSFLVVVLVLGFITKLRFPDSSSISPRLRVFERLLPEQRRFVQQTIDAKWRSRKDIELCADCVGLEYAIQTAITKLRNSKEEHELTVE